MKKSERPSAQVWKLPKFYLRGVQNEGIVKMVKRK